MHRLFNIFFLFSSSIREMDQLIQNGLFNLEIETPHPHSSSQKEEVDKEVKRNWVELPADVMSLILLKLGVVNILVSAQCVCTSWWKLSKQPHLFRSINVSVLDHGRNSKHSSVSSNVKLLREVLREAIGRSCGQLVEFSVCDIANDELLHNMSEKSSSLRCLRLLGTEYLSVTDHGLIAIAKKLTHLEELKITLFSIKSEDVIEAFGRFCPQLKSCSLHLMLHDVCIEVNRVVLAIAENMHELRHFHFGNSLKDKDLRVILDGCPHLETLDYRQHLET